MSILVLAATLTLRAAAGEALAHDPAIAAADARRTAAAAVTTEARAGRWPRIDAAETITRGNNPVFVFGSLLEQGAFSARHFDPSFLNAPDPLTNYRASLTARVALFDGQRTANAVRQAENAKGRADLELEDVRQRIRAEVVTRYYGLAVAQQKLEVAREAARAAEAGAKAARDRFELGLIVESDALSAEVQLAGFRQRVIAAEGDLAIARAALAMLLGRPAGDAIEAGAELPEQREPAGMDEAVARALANRAAVKIAASGTSDAKLQLATSRASLLPRVDAFATLGASGGTFGDRNADHLEGVTVSIELFDRGRRSRIAAARAAIEGARAAETMARDAVTMEVIRAWHRLRVASESANVASNAVTQAEAAARIVRDRYDQGLTTITELLRVESALANARFELLAARYERTVAQTELQRATGELDDL